MTDVRLLKPLGSPHVTLASLIALVSSGVGLASLSNCFLITAQCDGPALFFIRSLALAASETKVGNAVLLWKP